MKKSDALAFTTDSLAVSSIFYKWHKDFCYDISSQLRIMDEPMKGPQKRRNARAPGGRKNVPKEDAKGEERRASQYFEPEIHHAPFKDKSRRPLSSEALEDFEIDGE